MTYVVIEASKEYLGHMDCALVGSIPHRVQAYGYVPRLAGIGVGFPEPDMEDAARHH